MTKWRRGTASGTAAGGTGVPPSVRLGDTSIALRGRYDSRFDIAQVFTTFDLLIRVVSGFNIKIGFRLPL